MTRKQNLKFILTLCLTGTMLFTASVAVADEIPTVPTPVPTELIKEFAGKVLGNELEFSEETAALEEEAEKAAETELETKLKNGIEVQAVVGVVNAEGLKVRALPNPDSEIVAVFLTKKRSLSLQRMVNGTKPNTGMLTVGFTPPISSTWKIPPLSSTLKRKQIMFR